MPYRNYDPVLGRFVQVDPLAHQQHDMSAYQYAGNSPIRYNDPSGLTFTGAGAGRPDWVNDLVNEFGIEMAGAKEYSENGVSNSGGVASANSGYFKPIYGLTNFKKNNATVSFDTGIIGYKYVAGTNEEEDGQGGYLTFNETYEYSRMDFTPLDENIGYQIANYKMRINVRVDQVPVYEGFKLVGYKWQATVSALSKVAPRPAGDLSSNVSVSVLLNGMVVAGQSTSVDGMVVIPAGWSYVGNTSIDLPTATGNVQLQLTGSWTVSGPEGVAVPVYQPIFAPVSININQSVNLVRY